MIGCSYTIPNPWTMMIKLSYTAITHRAMLGTNWLSYKACATKNFGIEATTGTYKNQVSLD